MVKYIFSETEEIAKKNRARSLERPEPLSLLDYSKPNVIKLIVPKKYVSYKKDNKPNKKEYDYCRRCYCKLERKASRIWGICPSCDME